MISGKCTQHECDARSINTLEKPKIEKSMSVTNSPPPLENLSYRILKSPIDTHWYQWH